MRPFVRNLLVASGIVAVTAINVALAHRTASASGTAAAKAAIAITVVTSGQGRVGNNGQRLAQSAACPAGTTVIGGSFYGQTSDEALVGKDVVIATTSMIDQRNNSWHVNWLNRTLLEQVVQMWAICLKE